MTGVITKYVSDYKRYIKTKKGEFCLIRKQADLKGIEVTSIVVIGKYPGNSAYFKELILAAKQRIV